MYILSFPWTHTHIHTQSAMEREDHCGRSGEGLNAGIELVSVGSAPHLEGG